MPSLPLSPAVVYGGLCLALLGLVVAALQQKWSLRVFMLCALRVAIGWHFLFEGLHKLHSYAVGPTDTNKPFSSEMFHATAEGPAGPIVRRYFLDDTEKMVAEKTRLTRPVESGEFLKLPLAEQAQLCPPAVAAELEAACKDSKSRLEEELVKAKEGREEVRKKVDPVKPRQEADAARPKVAPAVAAAAKAEEEAETLSAEAVLAKGKGTEADWQAAKDKAAAARAAAREARREANEAQSVADGLEKKAAAAKKKLDDADAAVSTIERRLKIGEVNAEPLKAAYAAWVCGADVRDAKVKFLSSDIPQTIAQRQRHVQIMREELAELTARQNRDLGNGYGYEMGRTKALKADIRTAETDVLKDADALTDELKKAAGWRPDPDAPKESRTIDRLDKVTAWAITIMGACLLAGLFTRLNCVLAAGFLIMTVLEHPTVPWLPLPPNTEGNPVFVNKNTIEALALLAIATFPTGRWFGLDAMIGYVFCGKKKTVTNTSQYGPYPAKA